MAPSSFDSVEIEDVSEEGVVGVVGERNVFDDKSIDFNCSAQISST